MKTSLIRSKSSFALALILCSANVMAKPVALVTAVSGQVFAIAPDGKTNSLVQGQRLEDKTEVIVSEGSSITLNDYYDATYSLISGTHVKFFDKSVLLKKGKTWIQSLNSKHPLALTTANGHVDYWKGEFITTFDQATSRSQVLVVNGEIEISNVLEKNMKYTVTAGSFTLVDPEVESGVPRAPTKVGLASLNDAVAEFKGSSFKKEAPAPIATARSIASVEEAPAPTAPVKRGEIIFLNAKRTPASVGGSAHQYWKKKVIKEKGSTDAPIKFYGLNASAPWTSPALILPAEILRRPASVKMNAPKMEPKKIGAQLNSDADFTNSLRQETAQQPKYSKELENLIQDLKSY